MPTSVEMPVDDLCWPRILTAGRRAGPKSVDLRSGFARPRSRSSTWRSCVLAITGAASSSSSKACCSTAVWRFRRSSRRAHGEPPQVYGSKPIEIAWTAAPALIVFVLVLVTARTLWEVEVPPPQPAAGRQRAVRHGRSATSGGGSTSTTTTTAEPLGFITANELHVPASDGRRAAAGLPDPEVGRRLPQLLGAAAGRQDRPDPRPHQPHVVPDRQSPACTSASAPSTAAPSTPTCCCASSSIRRTSSSAGWRTSGSRPWTTRRCATGKAVFLRQSCVNCHARARHAGAGHLRPRPDAPDEPRDARLGHDRRTRPRTCRRWVDDPQTDQAGLPDAGVRPGRARAAT